MKKVLVGNHAVSWGVLLSRAEVIAAYPIMPQTQIVEELSEMCADGRLPARFIKVESEHSAMAACIGASAAGVRAFTATSSQGLLLMHELLHWAGLGRLPIVMADVNRALAPGWTVWTDQNDTLSQRDTGWIQLYCESNQEVLDTTIQAFQLAEAVAGIPAGTRVVAGSAEFRHADTCGAVGKGEGFWFTNSVGLIELAINRGSAAEKLGLKVGDGVQLFKPN